VGERESTLPSQAMRSFALMTSTSEQPSRSDSPKVGEPLPRVAEAFGVREKWDQWILAGRGHGWEWARVFRVGPADVEEIWRAVADAVLDAPISSIRELDVGVSCEVQIVLKIGARAAPVRTVWHYADAGAAPRLVTAYPIP
jgi:hypothetical protein